MLLASLLSNQSLSFVIAPLNPHSSFRTAKLLHNEVSPVVYSELEVFFVWSPAVCSVERVTGSLTISGSMTAG